jgi:hypothetical protein
MAPTAGELNPGTPKAEIREGRVPEAFRNVALPVKGAVGQDLDVTNAIGLTLAAGPERWTATRGGCPILVDGECIGGIGVAGGDWNADLKLAQDAVESIGATWDPDKK